MRITVPILIALVVLIAGYLFYTGDFQFPDVVVNGPIAERKSADFCGSTPMHGDTMATAPKEIVICSEGILRKGSSVYITRTNARELGFGEGETLIDADKHTLRYTFSSTLSPSDWKGLYTVTYKLCTTVSCSTGQFQFTINPVVK